MWTMPPDRTDQAFLHVVIETNPCVDMAGLIIRAAASSPPPLRSVVNVRAKARISVLTQDGMSAG